MGLPLERATFGWVSLALTFQQFKSSNLVLTCYVLLHTKGIIKCHSRELALLGDYPLNAVELNVKTGNREDPFRLRVF